MTQSETLHEYLKKHPEGASIRDLRNELWIQNIQEAARQLRKKGVGVETFEMRKTDSGRSVNGYRLVRDKLFNIPPSRPTKRWFQ